MYYRTIFVHTENIQFEKNRTLHLTRRGIKEMNDVSTNEIYRTYVKVSRIKAMFVKKRMIADYETWNKERKVKQTRALWNDARHDAC